MAVRITIGAVDRTASIPLADAPDGTKSWIDVEETVAGSATATMRLYDPTNSIVVGRLAPIVVADLTNGKNIFNGYVQVRELEIVATYRYWHLSCVDLNAILDTTLVGVPNGTAWELDDAGAYTPIDPQAMIQGDSDAANVARLFAAYWVFPTPIDTSTFVTAVNPNVGAADGVVWTRATLRGALDEIATLSSPFTVYWIDADAKLHWTNKPQEGAPVAPGAPAGSTGNLLMLFPFSTTPAIEPATYDLTDGAPAGGQLNYENFRVRYDDTGAALSMYANGATDYTMALSPRPTPDGIVAAVTRPVPSASASAFYVYLKSQIGIYLVDWSDPDNPARTWTWVWYGSPGMILFTRPMVLKDPSGHAELYYVIYVDGSLTVPDGYAIWSGHNPPIRIYPVTTNPNGLGASLGVGGTGWVGGGSPSWLSRYIDLPAASSRSGRDTQGGVALSYASASLVRGYCEVVHANLLFRAGNAVKITSVQAGMTASVQMIQRVKTSFLSGTDVRRASLEWGTGPIGSIGLRAQARTKVPKKLGSSIHVITMSNHNPQPGSTVTARTQICDVSGWAWHVRGKKVDWTVAVYDRGGNDVTASTKKRTGYATGWSLTQTTSISDNFGKASTRLHLAAQRGLQYFISASSPD